MYPVLDYLLIIIICCVFALIYATIRSSRYGAFTRDVFVGGGSRQLQKPLQQPQRSKTEHHIIKLLESILRAKFPTQYPKWLVWKGKQLELDGYNEKLKLAIEVDGWWHHNWESTKEPYEKYFERLVKDVVKDRLCKKKGVTLIRVDSKLPTIHRRAYLLSRLYDAGFIDNEPDGYISKQEYDSFRNEVLEKELGLDAEMRAARKL